MYGTIRQAIITFLQSDAIDKIKAAYRTDRSKLGAVPAAIVFPSEHEADYFQTGGGNKETYIFTIRVLYPFTEGQEDADLALEEALDQIIDGLRTRDVLDLGTSWVEPVPGKWGYQTRGEGNYRVAELNVRVIVYVEDES